MKSLRSGDIAEENYALLTATVFVVLVPPAAADGHKSCTVGDTFGNFTCGFMCDDGDTIWAAGNAERGSFVDVGGVCGAGQARGGGMNSCQAPGTMSPAGGTGDCELFEGKQGSCAAASSVEEACRILKEIIPQLDCEDLTSAP
jgi:hypothetical protein